MNDIIVVRGGGDIATGIIQKLYRCGFKVLVLEIDKPSTIRTNVALSQAVYDKDCQVEDIRGILVNDITGISEAWSNNKVPIYIDQKAHIISELKPLFLIDAIIAKRNMGTNKTMAPYTIALGPGFKAGEDVDIVVETMRGHHLGKLYFKGYALPNTGIPGVIGGQGSKRVIHSRKSGNVYPLVKIGDIVEEGQAVLRVANEEYYAPFKGLIRGMIREGYQVNDNFKIADIDPRLDVIYNEISDKARSIGGAVLEAVLILKRRANNE